VGGVDGVGEGLQQVGLPRCSRRLAKSG
jgi:hypothetical protein